MVQLYNITCVTFQRKPVLQTLGDASATIVPTPGLARDKLVHIKTFKQVLELPALGNELLFQALMVLTHGHT